ncbi:AAA family ATPase [bacterium]|nr:AAA family ATPase [bacterium]
MYLEHFDLNVMPFGLSPKLDFLYRSAAFEESMAHLVYGLDNSEAIVVVTGAIGTGKTMALQSFLTHLGERFAFALITNTQVTTVELLKLILEDLGVRVEPGLDKSDLLIRFKEVLLANSRDGRKVLVVVDEAQNLARDVLEEIRLLTNLGQGESQPVQIILLGQPELEEMLRREDLAQLRQRIRVHYRFEPLSRAEVGEYIDHRMSVAGCEESVFEAKAIDRIFAISGGVPRVVNTLAGEGLLSAFVAGRKRVRPEDIEMKEDGLAVPEHRSDLPPAPRPAPAPVPRAKPAPEPAPVPESRPAERPRREAPPVMAVRSDRHREGGRRGLGWLVAVVLVVAAAAAWYLGWLDGVRELVSRPSAEPAATAVRTDASPSAVAPAATEDARTADQGEVATSVTAVPAAETSATASGPSAGVPASAGAQPVAAVTPPSPEGFFIHISSFRTLERAETQVRRIESRELPALTRTEDVRGTTWFRVYIGPYADREAARQRANELKDAGRISYYQIVRLGPVGT